MLINIYIPLGDRMCEVAYEFRDLQNELKDLKPTSKKYKEITLKIEALNQLARELLLAQSSDWLFIITNGTMVDYAKKRIKDHIGRFTKLYHQIKENKIDKKYLKDIELKDDIFPDIDYRIYS